MPPAQSLQEEAVAHSPECSPGSPGTPALEGNVARFLPSLV